jgi:flagellar biosynthesis protein FlhB
LLGLGGMAEDKDRRTEPPSKRKLDQARKKGEVALSRELAGACAATAGVVALVLDAGRIAADLRLFLKACFSDPTPALWRAAVELLIQHTGIIGGAAALAALFALVVQVGLRFSMRLQFSRLNPVTGLGRMFNGKRFVDLLLLFGKLFVVVCIAWLAGVNRIAAFIGPGSRSLGETAGAGGRALLEIMSAMLVFALLGGVFDFWLQRRRFFRRMRMTRKEVADEHKEQEGDPGLKSERRRRHRQLLQGIGMASIKRARVVVVNPTHIAVALGYDGDQDEAPWVVAAGRGSRAMTIRMAASRLGIPIVEQVPLARALIALEPGQEIPEQFYEATAEIIRAIQDYSASFGRCSAVLDSLSGIRTSAVKDDGATS